MYTDLELYRVFCEVVKYKNISKAAESMYLSQSAVTQSIKKLENMLGGNVFYRKKNGVELTEEGKNLYAYIKDSIETMSNAENIFSQYIHLEKGNIRIGGGNSLISSLLMQPILAFIQAYPHIDISINSGLTDSLIQKLANGELDLVALNLPFEVSKYSHIEVIPLKKAKYAFFCSKQYAKEHGIKNLKTIENCKYIVPKTYSSKSKILNEYRKQNAIDIYPNYEVSSTSIMKQLVLQNVGIGFAKIEALEDSRENIKIIKEIPTDKFEEGIAIRKRNMCNRATVELVEKIQAYYTP